MILKILFIFIFLFGSIVDIIECQITFLKEKWFFPSLVIGRFHEAGICQEKKNYDGRFIFQQISVCFQQQPEPFPFDKYIFHFSFNFISVRIRWRNRTQKKTSLHWQYKKCMCVRYIIFFFHLILRVYSKMNLLKHT